MKLSKNMKVLNTWKQRKSKKNNKKSSEPEPTYLQTFHQDGTSGQFYYEDPIQCVSVLRFCDIVFSNKKYWFNEWVSDAMGKWVI